MNTSVNDYIINMNLAHHIVYCRFGDKFITDLEKRKHSNICQSNQPSSSLANASYLINIKKLIEEHNIKGDKRDFKALKTNKMGIKNDEGPKQYYKLAGPEDRTLIFESRFESGNLLAAMKITEFEYDLVL